MATEEMLDDLGQAVAEVLDVQAFMFTEPAAAAALEPPEGGCLRASISYQGATRGTVEIAFPTGLCADLAANMLGIEADELEDPSEAGDALGELLNVACGQFLTRRFGSGQVFTLSIPQTEPLADEHWLQWRDGEGVVGLSVDFSPVLVRIATASTETP